MNFRSGGGGVSKLSDSTDCAAKSNSCKLHSLFNIKEEELWMFVFFNVGPQWIFWGRECLQCIRQKKAKILKKKLDFCFALQTWLHSWLDKYLEKEVEFIAQIASSYERRRLSFFFIPLKPVLLKKLVLKHHHPISTTIGFVASKEFRRCCVK